MRKVRARAETITSGRYWSPPRGYRKWYKRRTSKLRRRMERAGMEPMNMRSLTRGWYD